MKFSIFQKLYLAIFTFCVALPSAFAQFPPVDVTKGPIFAAASRVNPNMILDLSVEWPTVSKAYTTTTFDPTKSYVGYWDSNACYSYSGTSNQGYNATGYFVRAGTATSSGTSVGICNSNFSGSMLNWAASSAIDMLRLAITGGDRVIDTATQTVLQRAFLSNGQAGGSPSFYNGAFPRKQINTADVKNYTPYSGNSTVYIYNCENKIFFGTNGTGASCTNPGTNTNAPGGNADLGGYMARVEVCSSTEVAANRKVGVETYCKQYPSGNYKPIGAMQKYADSMRFSAFGYLNNQSQSKYSGVLRAPMKYVGPNTYDANLNKSANTQQEWDASTGIFTTNPLNDALGKSGVVNYLNQFGRTSTTPGSYKSYDDVSELYYESIRYLQGLQPSPQLTSTAITPTEQDGFPAYTSWSDPITQSCQKNFILTIADSNTWYDKTIPGNTTADANDQARAAAGNVDVMKWTRLVGGFETNGGLSYTDSLGRSQTTIKNLNPNIADHSLANLDTQATGAGASASYYMAGLAYYANTQPIRTDTTAAGNLSQIRAQTFSIDVDETTGTVGGLGTVKAYQRGRQLYLTGKYGGFVDKNNDGNPFVASGNVNDNTEWASGVDDDGLPLPSNYFLAGKPDKMIASIQNIFSRASDSSGTISGASVSSSKVDATSGAFVYVPVFKTTKWSGSVLAYKITYDASTGVVSVSSSTSWDAGKILTGDPTATIPLAPRAPASRKIFTAKPDGTGITFDYASLDPTQQTLLNTEYYTAASDGLGPDRVNYLRGDRTKEAVNGGAFRNRDSVMGDVINSAPVSAGAKPSRSVIGDGYSAWYEGLTRTAAVYVGTNDGMLHAFNAANGTELFAFVPPMVIDKISALTSPSYVHMPLVDAPPVVAEANLSSTAGSPNWKTVLVSGVGGGAQGVFALDVTHPEAFIPSSYLWQFTDKDDSDMGFLMTSPKIYKFRTGANTYKWYAAVVSGYDNYTADGTGTFSANGAGALFLLDISKVSTVPWQRNVNYYKIVLPVGGTGTSAITDASIGNALSTPAALRGSQGEVQYLYAGDIQGNVWKFDFTSPTASALPQPWSEANALAYSQKPFFTAVNADNKRQPITVEPTIASVSGGGTRVLVGTGKFIETLDLVPSGYITQSIYGLLDDGNNNAASRITSRTQLAQRTATSSNAAITGSSFVYGNATGQKKGWYFDFPNSKSTGERQVTNMVLFAGDIYFNTLQPSGNVCDNGGGGNTCVVNSKTGLSNGATCTPSTVGLLSSPVILELDTSVSGTNSSGQGKGTTKTTIINIGTGDKQGNSISPGATKTTQYNIDRLTWREIVDFKEQKIKP